MLKVKVFKIKDDERKELLYEYNSKKKLDKPFEIRDEILGLQKHSQKAHEFLRGMNG